ncbi:MAG: AI-2E family transporter [Vampirovibrionia bacterium]
MGEEKLTKNLKILAIITLLIVILYAIFSLCAIFMNLVTITGIAIVLAYVLLGPVNVLDDLMTKGIEKLRPNSDATKQIINKLIPFIQTRILSIFIVYITFFLVVIITGIQLIPPAIYQISELAKKIPSYAEESISYVNKNFPEIQIPGITDVIKQEDNQTEDLTTTQEEEIPEIEYSVVNINDKNQTITKDIKTTNNKRTHLKPKHRLENVVKATASKFQNDITSFVTNNAQNAINNLLLLLAGTLTSIGYTITVLVLSFYFILDGKNLINGINKLIPEEHLKRAQEIEKAIHESLFGFLKGQVLLGIATGVFMFFIYTIFDVNYSVFLSLFLALAEIIPVIGSSLGFIPAIIVIVFTDPVKLPLVWLIFLIFQSIKDNIVAPKIVGEIIGLHPVTVIFALWIGYQVAGFFGILFAIPVASVLNVIVSFIIQDRSSKESEAQTN